MSNRTVRIFTIGFTGSNAEHFFTRLHSENIKKVIDTRLWASSQLAGFAKKQDLPYFLKKIVNIDYEYRKDLAPSEDILKAYKDGKINWNEYEIKYKNLIHHRDIANVLKPQDLAHSCFLCACKTQHQCHRRILVEYLQDNWSISLEVKHL